MTENIQPNPKRQKHSSLKMNNCLFPDGEGVKKKSKRLSVNWNLDLKNVNYQEMKISFDVSDPVKKTSTFGKEKFKETRKRSTKDEFTLAKEMLKNYNLYDDLEGENIETLKNTKMNYEVGKLSTDSNEKTGDNE